MKQTKEELLKDNVLKDAKICRLQDQDEIRRVEFAKAFNWKTRKNEFDYTGARQPITPTWEEIFVEVGKLLAMKDFRNFEDRISNTEYQLNELLLLNKAKEESLSK